MNAPDYFAERATRVKCCRHLLPRVAAALLALCGILKLFLLRRILRAHFAWDSNLLAIFGLPFFAYLLLRSVIQYKRGKVAWKGRLYPGSPAA